MQISCITLFPGMLDAIKCGGVVGRAIERGDVQCDSVNPRDYWFKMKIRVKTEAGLEL